MIPVTLDNRIRIRADALLNVPDGFIPELEKSLTFENPRYFADMKYRPESKPERLFRAYYRAGENLLIHRGWMPGFIRLCQKYRTAYQIEDRTTEGEEVKAVFRGTLRGYQNRALQEMLKKRFGLIIGPVHSGKKVLTAAWIGEKRRSTLIVCKSRMQLFIWENTLKSFLHCPEDIGVLGGGRNDLGKKILISTDRTLYRHIPEFKEHCPFGAVILDGADEINLRVLSGILAELPTRYMIGLSVSASRPDKNTAYAKTYTGTEITRLEVTQSSPGQGGRQVKVVPTKWTFDYRNNWHDMISELCHAEERNAQTVEDILAETAETRRRAIVFSERTDHLHFLKGKMAQRNAEVINGKTGPEEADKIILQYNKGRLQIVFCTFRSMEKLRNMERADVIFITTPVRYSETLAQVMGLLMHPKSLVYDYRDEVEILKGALRQRLKFYRKTGCEVRG